jgi:hypothetical protein
VQSGYILNVVGICKLLHVYRSNKGGQPTSLPVTMPMVKKTNRKNGNRCLPHSIRASCDFFDCCTEAVAADNTPSRRLFWHCASVPVFGCLKIYPIDLHGCFLALTVDRLALDYAEEQGSETTTNTVCKALMWIRSQGYLQGRDPPLPRALACGA